MRPIDADEVLKIVERYGTTSGTSLGRHSGIADIIYYQIEKLPTIEAEPERHGKWRLIHNTYDRVKEYNCSNCDSNYSCESNYCPNCGAKMDKDNNEK